MTLTHETKNPNQIAGTVAGAVIGGVIGNQIGSGKGMDYDPGQQIAVVKGILQIEN